MSVENAGIRIIDLGSASSDGGREKRVEANTVSSDGIAVANSSVDRIGTVSVVVARIRSSGKGGTDSGSC